MPTTSADNDFVINDPAEFAKCVAPDARVRKLAGGFKFTEGPAWLTGSEGGFLVFSDIPASEMKKWTPEGGIAVFRKPSNQSNGNTVDRQGRLITCEHESRRVTRTEKDGTITVLAERFEGKRLNSPNDVVVKSDDTIWFTDPPYGLPRQTEGKELDKQHVFRLDPATGKLTSLISDMDRPNGLCFSPDEKRLYVANSGQARHIRVFDVRSDGTVANGRLFCEMDIGAPDGIRCDADGRVWSSAGDGVHIFSPDGKLIGKILTPLVDNPQKPGQKMRETPANLCFGGADGRTLFMTARTSLYAIPVRMGEARRPR
jgi:gluconolactonase